MNPSSRIFSKTCTKCGCTFECNEAWITMANLEEWKTRMKNTVNEDDQPLLCRLRTACLCDECRNPGSIVCETIKKDPLEDLV